METWRSNRSVLTFLSWRKFDFVDLKALKKRLNRGIALDLDDGSKSFWVKELSGWNYFWVNGPLGQCLFGSKSFGSRSFGSESFGLKSFGLKSFGLKSFDSKSFGWNELWVKVSLVKVFWVCVLLVNIQGSLCAQGDCRWNLVQRAQTPQSWIYCCFRAIPSISQLHVLVCAHKVEINNCISRFTCGF